MEVDGSQDWPRYAAKSATNALPATEVSYDPGYVVLSFFTSLVGCLTTIELLQRRTSTNGLYNWYVLDT